MKGGLSGLPYRQHSLAQQAVNGIQRRVAGMRLRARLIAGLRQRRRLGQRRDATGRQIAAPRALSSLKALETTVRPVQSAIICSQVAEAAPPPVRYSSPPCG